jgi:hypothetical protein
MQFQVLKALLHRTERNRARAVANTLLDEKRITKMFLNFGQ